MKPRNAWKTRFIIAGALALGFMSGCWVKSILGAQPRFLGANNPLTQKEETSGNSIESVSYYSVARDWKQIYAQAKKELPTALSRDEVFGGMRAKVLTVPRFENGRLQLSYPPQQEFTFLSHRLAINNAGAVVALRDADQPWTGIQMREYRSPRPLDSIVQWFRRTIKS